MQLMYMSSVNTGMERAYELAVARRANGVYVDGYPRVYRMTDEFGTFTAIRKEDISTMSATLYQARLKAFAQYVENVEIGVKVNTDEAYRKNLTACPI